MKRTLIAIGAAGILAVSMAGAVSADQPLEFKGTKSRGNANAVCSSQVIHNGTVARDQARADDGKPGRSEIKCDTGKP